MAAARKAFGVERGLIAHEVVARRDVGPLENPNALVEIEAWVDPTRTPLVSPESPSRGHGGDRGGERGWQDVYGTVRSEMTNLFICPLLRHVRAMRQACKRICIAAERVSAVNRSVRFGSK